jgi:hypothetical protein
MSRDILTSMLTYFLAGYLLGLTIGFTVFDPDLDAWALLGALFSLIGLVVGIAPLFRRYMEAALLMIIGYYLGMLIGRLLFGDLMHDGMIEALDDPASAITMLIGAVIGLGVGLRHDWRRYRMPLFAFVFGGFITPLLLIVLAGLDDGSEIGLNVLVLIFGALWGGFALWQQRHSMTA